MNLNAIKRLRKELGGYKYKCKKGCFECCTVVPFTEEELKLMKKELFRKGFTDLPRGKGASFCSFLTQEGACSVYDERPIICRSFGNIQWKFHGRGGSKAVQACTYSEPVTINASKDFHDYGRYVSDKGIVLDNAEDIVKNSSIPSL